jgi:hypothetical protein
MRILTVLAVSAFVTAAAYAGELMLLDATPTQTEVAESLWQPLT